MAFEIITPTLPPYHGRISDESEAIYDAVGPLDFESRLAPLQRLRVTLLQVCNFSDGVFLAAYIEEGTGILALSDFGESPFVATINRGGETRKLVDWL